MIGKKCELFSSEGSTLSTLHSRGEAMAKCGDGFIGWVTSYANEVGRVDQLSWGRGGGWGLGRDPRTRL